MKKLDQRTEMSFLTEESYEPINSGPAPKLRKPRVVPSLDFNKMSTNLEKERKKAEIAKKEQRYK